MKFRSVIPAALFASLALTATAQAQGVNPLGGTWDATYTPGTQTDEYWNNVSDDGATCNIGYFVRGTGFGPCANQNPTPFASTLNWASASYLSFTPPGVTSRVLFDFDPGTYNITFLGQIAGANPARQMGIRSTNGSNQVNTVLGAFGTTIQITATTNFEFYLDTWSPTGGPAQFLSRSGPSTYRQFAVFANGPNGQTAGEWLVGSEDNGCDAVGTGCPRASDWDFNDGMALVRLVPEPSTYALMGFGLLSMAGIARRRRNIA